MLAILNKEHDGHILKGIKNELSGDRILNHKKGHFRPCHGGGGGVDHEGNKLKVNEGKDPEFLITSCLRVCYLTPLETQDETFLPCINLPYWAFYYIKAVTGGR